MNTSTEKKKTTKRTKTRNVKKPSRFISSESEELKKKKRKRKNPSDEASTDNMVKFFNEQVEKSKVDDKSDEYPKTVKKAKILNNENENENDDSEQSEDSNQESSSDYEETESESDLNESNSRSKENEFETVDTFETSQQTNGSLVDPLADITNLNAPDTNVISKTSNCKFYITNYVV